MPLATRQGDALRLVDQVNQVRLHLSAQGHSVQDMSRAASLESLIGSDGIGDDENDTSRPVTITRIESSRIKARRVATAAPGASRFRYFLDGSQKSVPIFRIGIVPIVSAVVVAGVLQRDDQGNGSLAPGALQVRRAWIVPRKTGIARIDGLVSALDEFGYDVVDPFCDHNGDPLETYVALTGDYARALSRAFETVRTQRARLESDLAQRFLQTSDRNPDDWVVFDGRLHGNTSNAIGLVKSLDTQLLAHDEAVTLFDLPQGSRTTAFRYASSDPDFDARHGKTMWYVRLWDANGLDARHGLVRIDAANDVDTTDQIDEITSWVLAERLPRATDDPRWPTLLYPISLLERVMKRRLAAITAGWPSA